MSEVKELLYELSECISGLQVNEDTLGCRHEAMNIRQLRKRSIMILDKIDEIIH